MLAPSCVLKQLFLAQTSEPRNKPWRCSRILPCECTSQNDGCYSTECHNGQCGWPINDGQPFYKSSRNYYLCKSFWRAARHVLLRNKEWAGEPVCIQNPYADKHDNSNERSSKWNHWFWVLKNIGARHLVYCQPRRNDQSVEARK